MTTALEFRDFFLAQNGSEAKNNIAGVGFCTLVVPYAIKNCQKNIKSFRAYATTTYLTKADHGHSETRRGHIRGVVFHIGWPDTVVRDLFCRFRCRIFGGERNDTDPARQRDGHVGLRLDRHTPALRRTHYQLEPVLGRVQSRVWINRQQLLARLGKHAPSNQLTALPTVGSVLSVIDHIEL